MRGTLLVRGGLLVLLGAMVLASAGCVPVQGDAGGTPTSVVDDATADDPADDPAADDPADDAVPGSAEGVVEYVVDGDTLDVTGVGRIRVIGIDTPERGECGFENASAALSALVLGERVTLVPGAVDDADRYGRLLRYVDLGAVDAGLSLIEDGWAIARYDSRDGYGRHPREDAYVAADAGSPDLGCYPDSEP
jgi:endonuclease YncB( thermonuclease family)